MALTSVEEAQLRDLIAQQSALLSLASSESTIISKLGATKKNLSEVPSATVLNDADLLFVRQGTTDKSITGLTVKTGLTPADASETVKGIAELATQAETNAGVDNARIVTPLKLRFGFDVSLATNGYIAFPSWMSGLIIQWGTTGSIALDSSLVVTFQMAFPNNAFSIVGSGVTSMVTGGANQTGFNFPSLTLTNFTITNDTTANTARWIAIGN